MCREIEARLELRKIWRIGREYKDKLGVKKEKPN